MSAGEVALESADAAGAVVADDQLSGGEGFGVDTQMGEDEGEDGAVGADRGR